MCRNQKKLLQDHNQFPNRRLQPHMREPNTSLDGSAHKQTVQIGCFLLYIQIQQTKHQNTNEMEDKGSYQKLHYITQT